MTDRQTSEMATTMMRGAALRIRTQGIAPGDLDYSRLSAEIKRLANERLNAIVKEARQDLEATPGMSAVVGQSLALSLSQIGIDAVDNVFNLELNHRRS